MFDYNPQSASCIIYELISGRKENLNENFSAEEKDSFEISICTSFSGLVILHLNHLNFG